jgi:hypothetical protein
LILNVLQVQRIDGHHLDRGSRRRRRWQSRPHCH